MSIKSAEEFEALKKVGRIVALALEAMGDQVAPGISTAELDRIGAMVLADHGARSAPPLVYGFPAAICISVNEEAIHGIPSARVIRPGDLVKLDVTAEKDGYMADAARTLVVQPASDEAYRLAECAEIAFRKALGSARAGHRIWETGMAVEAEVKRHGFSVIRQLCGHGIRRTIHEDPQVPNYADPAARGRLHKGLVITIEPIIAAGNGQPTLHEDGWTVKTIDGRLAAHYEHTICNHQRCPYLADAGRVSLVTERTPRPRSGQNPAQRAPSVITRPASPGESRASRSNLTERPAEQPTVRGRSLLIGATHRASARLG